MDVFAATAFGFAKGDKVLLRSGARPGDLLCVTGTVGLPITALTYFKQAKTMGFQLPEAVEQRLLQSWKRPIPRIVEGTLLADNDIANACQDVSDGLKATIEEISIRSGITFTIYSEALPVHAATNEVSKFLGISAAQLALSASVDFELLFTIPRAVEERCSALFKERELSFSVIGHTNSSGQNEIVLDGITVPLPGTAWNQQYGDLIEQVVRRP